MNAHTEKLIVLKKGDLGWLGHYALDCLPNMRPVDLLGLLQGIAEGGDIVQYQSQFFAYRGGTLKSLSSRAAKKMGLRAAL